MNLLNCGMAMRESARILTATDRNFNRVFTYDIAARNGPANE